MELNKFQAWKTELNTFPAWKAELNTFQAWKMELKSFKNGIENVPSLKPGAIFHNIDQIKVKRVLEGLKGHAILVIKVHIKKTSIN